MGNRSDFNVSVLAESAHIYASHDRWPTGATYIIATREVVSQVNVDSDHAALTWTWLRRR